MDHPINIIKLAADSKGVYSCGIPLSKEHWRNMLMDKTLVKPEFRASLLSFYFMPGHKATCYQCAEKYGYPINTYNASVSSLGRAIVKRLGTFKIEDEERKERFWPVVMGEGKDVKVNGKPQFEWKLRKELIEAIEEVLIDDAINQYTAGFEENFPKEEYKWQAVRHFQDKWDIEAPDFSTMFEVATAKTANLLASMSSYPRGMMRDMAKEDPEGVRDMFRNLFDESLDLTQRVTDFMDSAEKIRKKHNPGFWKMHYQSTNAVSTYLWLKYPDKYYIYKSSEYRAVIEKLGLDLYLKQNGKAEEMEKGYTLYNRLRDFLKEDEACVTKIREHLAVNDKLYTDPELRTSTIDFGFWISRYFDSAEKSLYPKKKITMTPFISEAADLLRGKKNLILQGAPGTGKTYNTAALALAIIDGTVPETHDEVMSRYEELRKENRIGFTTFHQSMDYEDFIEGIKPLQEGDTVRYVVEDGIFKRMCNAAKTASEVVASGNDNLLEGINDNPMIWKVSLDGTGPNATRTDCMKNGYIRIGFNEHGDIDYDEMDWSGKEGRIILKAFMKDMQIGDIVVSCWSQDETDAIGIVTGDYEYRAEGGQFPRYREVKWIVKGIQHNIKDINAGKHMTLGSVYRLNAIDLSDILAIIEQYAPKKKMLVENLERPFVLIVDEINRGNVSKIFGELITLLEKDKRLGDAHPVTLTLPYSKAPFGVPQNLYIIGTMNTTDRSTGTIDYAIRRRFRFLTLPANRDVIEDATAKALFDDVLSFIEKYKYADMDIEDLMVGHSYFMADNEEELTMKVKYEVIPLLKEYVKDGILSVKPGEAAEYFNAWSALQVFTKEEDFDDNDSGASED